MDLAQVCGVSMEWIATGEGDAVDDRRGRTPPDVLVVVGVRTRALGPSRDCCARRRAQRGDDARERKGGGEVKAALASLARLLVLAAIIAGYVLALLYAPISRAEGPAPGLSLESAASRSTTRACRRTSRVRSTTDARDLADAREHRGGWSGSTPPPIEEPRRGAERAPRPSDRSKREHRSAERGNHRWSRDLDWSGRKPTRWDELYPQLPWHFYRPQWMRVLERSSRLVRERPRLDVCHGAQPITWGGRYGLDAGVLARRNEGRARRGHHRWSSCGAATAASRR